MNQTGKMLEKAPLLAYLVLVICTILAVAGGANIYGRIAERSLSGSEIRTASQFVAMKIRQSDRYEGLGCADGRFYGYEYAGSETFVDSVYYYDGWLMELYQTEDAIMEGGMDDAGDKILPCGSASFEFDDGVVSSGLSVAGRDIRCAVRVRGGAGR